MGLLQHLLFSFLRAPKNNSTNRPAIGKSSPWMTKADGNSVDARIGKKGLKKKDISDAENGPVDDCQKVEGSLSIPMRLCVLRPADKETQKPEGEGFQQAEFVFFPFSFSLFAVFFFLTISRIIAVVSSSAASYS